MLRQEGSVAAMLLGLMLAPVVMITLAGATAMAGMEDAARDPSVKAPDLADLGKVPVLFQSELAQPDTLGVGRVARDVAEHLPALDAMATWLGTRVAELGYARARPVVARDNAEMIEFLRRGIVDVVSETPLSAIHFVKAGGATILLQETRSGQSTYHSVVFVRRTSTINTLAELRSHRVAFEDPGSTTAFLLPLASIRRMGMPAVALANAVETVPSDSVGYFFALSEKAIVAAVNRDVADAGALSNEEWKEAEHKNPASVADLRIIYESNAIPRAFVLTGPSVSASQREGLQELLLSMSSDSGGREALERYNKVDRFRAIDADAERSITDLEETYSLLGREMIGGPGRAN